MPVKVEVPASDVPETYPVGTARLEIPNRMPKRSPLPALGDVKPPLSKDDGPEMD